MRRKLSYSHRAFQAFREGDSIVRLAGWEPKADFYILQEQVIVDELTFAEAVKIIISTPHPKWHDIPSNEKAALEAAFFCIGCSGADDDQRLGATATRLCIADSRAGT